MKKSIGFLITVLLCLGSSAYGQTLQTFKDCVVGKRVTTNTGRKGVITRLDTPWSYCWVKFDDGGKEEEFLYSLLNSEGGLDAKDRQLAAGVYECVGNSTSDNRSPSDGPSVAAGGHAIGVGTLRITGPGTYSMSGSSGKFHVEASGKIVFETGPLKPYFSRLLSGGRVGLNADGGNFFATACELNRNLR